MKKTVVSIGLTVMLLLSLTLCANAACNSAIMNRSLQLTGSSATCRASVYETGSSISVTMELWQENDFVKSWSESNTSRVDMCENETVSSGHTYTLVVYGTINGIPFEMAPLVDSN